MHFYFVEWLSLWLFLLFPGVRQWYPLSSLLFGLAKDYLNRLLTDLVQSNDLNLMAATREVAALSHLLYVNDVLFFCKAFTCNICCISDAFAEYGELFGQLVNWEKSFLYTRINVSTSRCNFFLNLFCMKCSGLLFVYLDVLLFQGAPTISHLSPIVDRILTQLEACKGRLLSFLGRLCLINSIITSKRLLQLLEINVICLWLLRVRESRIFFFSINLWYPLMFGRFGLMLLLFLFFFAPFSELKSIMLLLLYGQLLEQFILNVVGLLVGILRWPFYLIIGLGFLIETYFLCRIGSSILFFWFPILLMILVNLSLLKFF